MATRPDEEIFGQPAELTLVSMSDRKNTSDQADLGTLRAAPGFDMQRDPEVCKLIDTTICIGCKACEVACVEWNDMPFSPTTFDNTYQTMPETRWNFWNLIKFNEHQREDGTDPVAHAQGPVHALRRSRLPARVSGRWRDRAVRQRHRRLPAGKLYWLRILRFGMSVRHSQVQSGDEEGLQVHPVFRPRRPGAGTGLHQGLSDRLPKVRHQGRHEVSSPRSEPNNCGRISDSTQAGVYDPQSIGGTHVVYVLHDATDPERYGGLPKDPVIPWSYTVWKWLAKPVLGTFALFGLVGVLLHYVTVGPRRTQPEPPLKEGTDVHRG